MNSQKMYNKYSTYVREMMNVFLFIMSFYKLISQK